MRRAAKPTGDWCAPTAELATPQLLKLLHSVKTTPDEAELEIVEDAPLADSSSARGAPIAEGSKVVPPIADAWFTEPDAPEQPIELVAEIGDHPEVEELSAEDEHAIAEAQSDALLATPTGAHLPLIVEDGRISVAVPPTIVKRPPPAPAGSVLRTLFAIVLVLGAAAGGVLIAMNVVSA